MKSLITLFLISIIFSSSNLSAQMLDSLTQSADSSLELSNNNFTQYNHIKELSDAKFKLLESENEVNVQRTYKYIFLTTALFIFLTALFTIVVFYTRAKKTSELLILQSREIELHENRLKQFTTILNNVETPLMITDESGEIQWLNRAFSAFYKFNLDDLKQSGKTNFINDIAAEDEKQKILSALEENKTASYTVASGNGGTFYRSAFPILDSEKNRIGIGIIDNLYHKQDESS